MSIWSSVRDTGRFLAHVALMTGFVVVPTGSVLLMDTANASGAPVPLLYLDATNSASYSGGTNPSTGTQWLDISGSNRHGTIRNIGASLTWDASNKAIQFPGGSNGTAYVELNANMNDFSQGLSLEFEGEFGSTKTPWERIFDFAAGVGSTDHAFWVGQLGSTNELTVEHFTAGTSQGFCFTATGGSALGSTRAFSKWVVTIDSTSPYKCRIYKDGVELATKVSTLPSDTSPTGSNPNGSDYSLPVVIDRTSAFLGRSNFVADGDFEGSIRYIRIYGEALTPEEVSDNANSTVTFNNNNGSGTMADQTSTSATTLSPNTFTRAGLTFAGWNTEQDGTGTAYADGATYPFSSSTTLYAQWRSTISYSAGVGGSGTAPSSPTTALVGSTFTTPVNTYERSGYTFGGWSDGNDVYPEGATYPSSGGVSGNVTLTAVWSGGPDEETSGPDPRPSIPWTFSDSIVQETLPDTGGATSTQLAMAFVLLVLGVTVLISRRSVGSHRGR